MGQHFEGTSDVERRVGIGQVERAAVADIEPSLPRFLQHSLGQVDAAGTLAERREPLEQKPGPAADLEQITSVTAPPTIEGRRLNVPTAPSRATLTLVSGPNAGAMYPLLLDESVIGRTRDCAIRIDDPGISRRHARIVRRGPEAYFLED